MRHEHLWIESMLIAITIFMGLGAYITSDTPSSSFAGGAIIWFIILAILQVFHSFVIGMNYWKNPSIRKFIIFYWIGVAVNFIFMFVISLQLDAILGDNIFILPVILALYLWYITFRHRL